MIQAESITQRAALIFVQSAVRRHEQLGAFFLNLRGANDVATTDMRADHRLFSQGLVDDFPQAAPNKPGAIEIMKQPFPLVRFRYS